jgi:hypothetical protein
MKRFLISGSRTLGPDCSGSRWKWLIAGAQDSTALLGGDLVWFAGRKWAGQMAAWHTDSAPAQRNGSLAPATRACNVLCPRRKPPTVR